MERFNFDSQEEAAAYGNKYYSDYPWRGGTQPNPEPIYDVVENDGRIILDDGSYHVFLESENLVESVRAAKNTFDAALEKHFVFYKKNKKKAKMLNQFILDRKIIL